MNNKDVKRIFDDFCIYMGLSGDELKAADIKDEEDLKYKILEVLQEYPLVFEKFLFKVFDVKTRNALHSILDDQYKIEGLTPLRVILKKSDLRKTFEHLKSKTGLTFPLLEVPAYKNLIGLGLYVVPVVILVVFVVKNFEFFAVSFVLLKWVFVTPLLFLPYFVFDLIFPSFFLPSKIPFDMTYSELISDLIAINRQDYMDNDWKLAYAEISLFLDSIDFN